MAHDDIELEGETCSICFDSNDFRTLKCGHCFCLECLEKVYELHDKIICPMDRQEDENQPRNLPTPHDFEGQLFIQTIGDERYVNINELLDVMVRQREKTISLLRTVARELNTHEFNCAGAKIGGSATAIVGAVLGAVGLSISLTGVGAIVGVPLGLAGMSIATAGGFTAAGAMVAESILKKLGIDSIQRDLQMDYFRSEQIKILLSRAAVDNNFAKKWNFDGLDVAYLGGMIPRMAKLGVTTAAGIRVALGIGRAAATTGLHIAGLVFAAAIIPLDIAQIVVSSIRVHKNEPSKVIKDIQEIADNLEKEMRVSIIDGDYFHLVETSDNKWCYVAVYATKIKEFKRRNPSEMTLEEIKEFGEVVREGEGRFVPDDERKKIEDEWYLHYDEYLARSLQESDENLARSLQESDEYLARSLQESEL